MAYPSLPVQQFIRGHYNKDLEFYAEPVDPEHPEGDMVVKDQTGKEWAVMHQAEFQEMVHPSKCPLCKGYRWFDDRGYPASGQPAFSFDPCPDCNPQGDREMWGNEPGDPGYKPGPDHRFRVLMADQTVGEYPPPKDK